MKDFNYAPQHYVKCVMQFHIFQSLHQVRKQRFAMLFVVNHISQYATASEEEKDSSSRLFVVCGELRLRPLLHRFTVTIRIQYGFYHGKIKLTVKIFRLQ